MAGDDGERCGDDSGRCGDDSGGELKLNLDLRLSACAGDDGGGGRG